MNIVQLAAGVGLAFLFAVSASAQGVAGPAAPQNPAATNSSGPAASGSADVKTPDAVAILAQAKMATGGTAWDALRSQHTKVSIVTGSDRGTAERWASISTGRSRMHLRVADHTDAIFGYDGITAWMAEASGKVGVQEDPDVMRLIVNAAYRDRLAFWFPERQAARIDYARRDSIGGEAYDVLRITPEGGLPYEMWIASTTHLVGRLREPERTDVRTETFSDFRVVQGVKLPFVADVTRASPGPAERYTVEQIEYNVPLDSIEFSRPDAGARH